MTIQYNTNLDTALKEKKIEMFINGAKCGLTEYDPVDDVYIGQTFNVGDVLTIKPFTGYVLVENGNYYLDWLSNGNTFFTLSADKKIGTLTYASYMDDVNSFNFSTQLEPIIIPPDDGNPIDNIKKGVNNVYLINSSTARQVMAKRFELVSAEGSVKDKAESIIGLINIPFTISDVYKTVESNIMLADYDTKLKGMVLNTDTLIFNMGKIVVSHTSNDLTDYQNVKTIINLPYSDSIELNPQDVVGYTVSIDYWVNVYNGETLINIYSSKNNALINNKKIDLQVSVPFNKIGNTPQNNAFNRIQSIGYNGINTAYIEVKTYDTILKNGVFTNPIIDEKTLLGEVGYIEVENIELTVNAMLQEKSEILNLLRQGIIIK